MNYFNISKNRLLIWLENLNFESKNYLDWNWIIEPSYSFVENGKRFTGVIYFQGTVLAPTNIRVIYFDVSDGTRRLNDRIKSVIENGFEN